MPLVASFHPSSIQPGEEALFRSIFEAEVAFVRRALKALGVRLGDLPDVAHDVFVTVVRRLGDYDRARPLRPWLFGIARRAAADHRRLARHRWERLSLEGHLEGRDDHPGAEEALESRQTCAEVQEALAALAADHRAVLLMHDVEGLGMPSIAAALSIPLNTGYSRLRLARRALRAAVLRRSCPIDGGAMSP